jgi:hypothetical protein
MARLARPDHSGHFEQKPNGSRQDQPPALLGPAALAARSGVDAGGSRRPARTDCRPRCHRKRPERFARWARRRCHRVPPGLSCKLLTPLALGGSSGDRRRVDARRSRGTGASSGPDDGSTTAPQPGAPRPLWVWRGERRRHSVAAMRARLERLFRATGALRASVLAGRAGRPLRAWRRTVGGSAAAPRCRGAGVWGGVAPQIWLCRGDARGVTGRDRVRLACRPVQVGATGAETDWRDLCVTVARLFVSFDAVAGGESGTTRQ